MSLLLFKIFAFKIYTLVHTLKPFFITFLNSDWGSSKTWFLNASTASSGVENVVHAIYLWLLGTGRSHWVPSRDCKADDPLIRCFEWPNTRLFHVMCVSSHYRDAEWFVVLRCFSQFTEYFWQTNGRIPRRIDGLLIFKGHSSNMTRFREETRHHLLRSASSSHNFCWIFFKFEDPNSRLLFCFGFIRINPWFVTCHDIVNTFGSTSVEFFKHFVAPTDTNLFWVSVNLCGIQRAHSFRTIKCSCKILCMLVADMPRVAFISRYVTWRSCSISFCTASMFSGVTTDIGRPGFSSSLSERRPRLNSLYQL